MLLDKAYAVLAMGGPPPGASPEEQKKAMFMQIGMMVFFVLIFYVMLIRPQQKKAKEQSNLIKALKAGDKVLTSAGIVGIVVGIKDNTVTIRSGESKLEITKSAVSEVTTERASA
jgi:preprotein translocase subunit YajC